MLTLSLGVEVCSSPTLDGATPPGLVSRNRRAPRAADVQQAFATLPTPSPFSSPACGSANGPSRTRAERRTGASGEPARRVETYGSLDAEVRELHEVHRQLHVSTTGRAPSSAWWPFATFAMGATATALTEGAGPRASLDVAILACFAAGVVTLRLALSQIRADSLRFDYARPRCPSLTKS